MEVEVIKLIEEKYGLDLNQPSPIEIPNVGRNDLGELFKEAGFMVGAEIGVERGYFTRVLFDANPMLKMYCIDSWKAHADYRDHISQSKFDEFFLEAQDLLDEENVIFIRKFSMDALADIKDESLDFVYIDANHEYNHVYEDIEGWSKKVKRGGIISGHDYIIRKFPKTHQVVPAVNDFVKDNDIKLWFLLGSRAKKEGTVRDAARSWMWVKL